MLDPKCIYPKCIFAKCTRLACLLRFASLFNIKSSKRDQKWSQEKEGKKGTQEKKGEACVYSQNCFQLKFSWLKDLIIALAFFLYQGVMLHPSEITFIRGESSLNDIGWESSKIGACWIFPSLSPLYSVSLTQLAACPHQQRRRKKIHSIKFLRPQNSSQIERENSHQLQFVPAWIGVLWPDDEVLANYPFIQRMTTDA